MWRELEPGVRARAARGDARLVPGLAPGGGTDHHLHHRWLRTDLGTQDLGRHRCRSSTWDRRRAEDVLYGRRCEGARVQGETSAEQVSDPFLIQSCHDRHCSTDVACVVSSLFRSSAPALSSSSAVAPGLHPATAAQHSSSPSTPAQPTPDPTSAVPAPSSDDPASSPSPPSASQQPAPAQHDEPAADQPPTTPAGPKRKKRSPSTKTSPEGNKKKGKADEGDEGEHTEHEGGEGAGSGTRD